MNKKNIEVLKTAVTEVFGRNLDSPSDFDALSLAIQNKVKQNISATTLKRVFGYIKSDSLPSTATMSILAQYAGYAGWSDFCRKNDGIADVGGASDKSPSQKKTYRRLIIPLSILSAVILTVFSIVLISNGRTEHTIKTEAPQPAPPPVSSESDMYNEILAACRTMTLEKCDSVTSLRGTIPKKEYMKLSQDSYYRIVFTQMKAIIETKLLEAFPDDDNRIRYDAIFSSCRDLAVTELYHQFSTEDYIGIHDEDNANN